VKLKDLVRHLLTRMVGGLNAVNFSPTSTT